MTLLQQVVAGSSMVTNESAHLAPQNSPRFGTLASFVLVFVLFSEISACAQLTIAAKQEVQAAMDVMGGSDVVARAHTIKTEEHRLNYHLADSERSVPPFIPDYTNAVQWIDFSVPALRVDLKVAGATGDSRTITQIAREGHSVTRSTFNGKTSPDRFGTEPPRWALQNPLLVMIAAMSAPDLHEGTPQVLFGSEHRRIMFDARGYRVTLWINRFNSHVDAVDLNGTDRRDMFWNEWGDVTLRTTYSDWHYEAGGLHYPHQWNIYFNGDLQETRSIDRLSVNPDMAGIDMMVPTSQSAANTSDAVDDFPLGRADRPIIEIMPGIVQIPGNWYVTLVRQPDGIVVIDAPISNGYSRRVIEEASKRFPGFKIKAVITTTNFWWHIAGLREYASRGIPIYALDQNVGLVSKLLASPHTGFPDALAKISRKSVVVGISAPRAIGKGENRLVMYPIRTATAQMLMTSFPERKLLHSAEMAQPLGPNGSFLFPESLLELRRAVEAQHLQVETLIGMHMSPTPWTKLTDALALAAEHGE